MTTKDQAIAPCPFCGHVGLDFNEGSTFRWLSADCTKCGATCGEVRIQTLGEGTKEEWTAQAQRDAIEVWNARKPAPDCRTCEHMWIDIELGNDESTSRCDSALCVNGDQYQPAPTVVLWRTD